MKISANNNTRAFMRYNIYTDVVLLHYWAFRCPFGIKKGYQNVVCTIIFASLIMRFSSEFHISFYHQVNISR